MTAESPRASSSRPFRVVIVGGGVAAIECALAVRALAPASTTLAIVASASEFFYRPLAVVRPFRSQPTYRIPLARVASDVGAQLVAQDAAALEAGRRQIVLVNGEELGYDALVIAIGADAEATLGGGTLTPWDWGEGHTYRWILDGLGKRREKSVAFIVPPGLTWPLPLYELALLTSAQLRKEQVTDVWSSFLTVERAPLEVFGAGASAAVAAVLKERGIALSTDCAVATDEEGRLVRSDGEPITAELTVAVPVIRARALDGVPTDALGFIPVDDHCRVRDTADVFAAGDCTDRPIKQGGLAAQQADTVAAAVAALAGAAISPEPYRPELHAVLLTGEAPLHLQATGATPIPFGDGTAHPQPGEKIVARHLTPYLARASPPLPLESPV